MNNEITKAQELRELKIVDSREPDTIRSKLLETGWKQRQLYSGEFMFYTHDIKSVGTTRKTVNDLLNSLFTKANDPQPKKTFAQHLEDMLNFYQIGIILIEGSWSTVVSSGQLVTDRGNYTWELVWNYLQSWMDRGFSLQLTVNTAHTIKRINQLYAYYQKPYHTGGFKQVAGDDRILAFPKGCRGKTAETILEHFGTLKNVANGSQQNYLTLDGIGKKKAELIYNHFNGKYVRVLQVNKDTGEIKNAEY